MFEKSESFQPLLPEPGEAIGDEEVKGARGGDALRAIEWSELTARLNAARQLRRELQAEAIVCAGSSGASFGDAAASFFKELGHSEQPVNEEHLEDGKASCGTPERNTGVSGQGDARDTL